MIIGIDLGTTKSVVGVWQNGKPHIILDRAGNQSIPSLVLVTSDEKIFTGRMAQKHPERYKGKNITISSIKRLMGRKGETSWGWWKTYPQEVSAFVLAELKNQAERYLDQEIRQAVIAIPSHFDESQRRATKEAAEIAGLEVIRLLNEATAAVLAYGFHKYKAHQKVLVFDLGGGTLDVSIVEFDFLEAVYEVICIEGDSKLGGDDFDQTIIDYILNQAYQKYGTTIELDPSQKMMLKEAAELAKIKLSGTLSTSIYIPGFLHIGESYCDLNVSIDRQIFERLSKNLFDRAFELLKKALDSAGIQVSDLNALLLLGGSSRIPYIRERIRRELRIEPFTGVDPEICVAQGAVIQAAVLAGELKDVLLLDAVPSSYGIGLKENTFSKIIEKNTTVPTKESQIFTTAKDNQSTITVKIYQGERTMASGNVYLSTVELRDIPPAAAGVPKIEITFDVDCNMIVHVSAKDVGTGKEQNIVVKSPYGLNNVQIRLMQQKLRAWLSRRRIWEIKPQVNSLTSSIDEILSKEATALNREETSRLRESGKSLGELMGKRVSYEELEIAISSTRTIYKKAQQKVSQYERVIKEINRLIAKIEKLIPILKPFNEKEASLLSQGGDLLKDYLRHSLSLNELQKMLLSVRSGYEEIKADLIKRELEVLETSEQMGKWIMELEDRLLNPSSMRQHLSKLRKIKEVCFIIGLLELENLECQKSIQRRILEKINVNSYPWAYVILIFSSFIDFHVISMTEEFLDDEKIGVILAFALFAGLDNNKTVDERRTAAQIIAKYLPAIQYLSVAVDYISEELDSVVSRYLVDYLNRHPPGAFHEFFMKADPRTTTKISTNKEMLIKLAKESDEKSCIFALESLAKFPSEKVMPVFLSFADNENSNIRAKTLELIIESKTKHSRVVEVFVQALRDPSPEIRLLALKFIEQTKETSCLPYVFALLQSEQSRIVKENAVTVLGSLKDAKVIPHLLKLITDDDQKSCTLALSSLKKNIELMEIHDEKLISLIGKVAEKKRSLGFKDKFFLWRFSRNHPEIDEVVQTLKEISRKYI